MIKYVIVTGLVYEGETIEHADAREREMIAHNNLVDELQQNWSWQKRCPMRSMIPWAIKHGVLREDLSVT